MTILLLRQSLLLLLKVATKLLRLLLLPLLRLLLLARKLFALSASRQSPAFWLNSLTTMIILLGQSVQDSANGKDVVQAFAVRMSLFIAVTLYACLMVQWLDRQRQPSSLPTHP